MENALTVFQFDNQQVRSLLDANGEPLFAATDICTVLDIINAKQAIGRLDSDETSTIYLVDRHSINGAYTTYSTIPTTEFNKPLSVVNESGLYNLIFTSRKPDAKRFKKWVTSEVLPSIRKTGSYTAKPLSDLEILERHVAIMKAQEAKLIEHEDRIKRIESRQTAMEDGSGFFTVLGYINFHKLPPIDFPTAQSIGRKATRLSNERGVRIGKATDPRFGEVNTYHEGILCIVMGRK